MTGDICISTSDVLETLAKLSGGQEYIALMLTTLRR